MSVIPRSGAKVGGRAPKILSIMPTYTCPAACTHCGTLSSPQERSNISLDTILSSIRQAKELSFGLVVFTGGEATLRWKDLLRGLSYARELSLPTRLVTNAHWAHTQETARRKVDELIAAGLTEINYSTGDEHVRFVPFERVVHATVAALERELSLHVMVEYRAERTVTRDTLLGHPTIEALPPERREALRITESPWMPLDPLVRERYGRGDVANRHNVGLRTGCESVLHTYVVQADGRVGACCGLGLRLIREMNVGRAEGDTFLAEAIAHTESDFLKLWIHYKGPEKILAWAAEKDPDIGWEDMYAHNCQACQRLYKDPRIARVIREHYDEMIAEVVQSAWLQDAYIPEHTPSAV